MSWPRRIVTATAALAFALVVLGVSIELLLVPAYTRFLVDAVDSPARADLPRQEAFALAEKVRAYVAGDTGSGLPARLDDGRTAFDADAVSHLDDVRDVMAGARRATLGAAVLAFGWLVWGLRGGAEHRRAVAVSLRAAALALTALIGVGFVMAFADFDWFFSAFHSAFFEEGTWQFPSDALLIRLFPEPFWTTSGAALGALVVLGAVLLGVSGWRVVSTPSTQDA